MFSKKSILKVRVFLVLFFGINLIYAEDNNDIKYFLDISLVLQNGIEEVNKNFRNELNKDLNPLNQELFTILKNFKEVPLERYYKVYYQNNIPMKAELIRTIGYRYIDGIIHHDKNLTKTNLGLVFQFDDKGREVYSYTIETGEKCTTFYGVLYTERSCTLDNEVQITKNYYENNKFRISIYYKNGILSQYINTTSSCDKDGKPLNPILDNLKKVYRENSSDFSDSKKKLFQNMIKEEEEKIKNIPDLNLTLEKQYINKIDRLNNRGGRAE